VAGKDLPVAIPRHLNRGFALREDGKGCYYTNHGREQGPRIRLLDLASGQEKLVFGEGFSPAEFISPSLFAGDRYLLITARKGWASNDLYWMDLQKDSVPRPIVKGINAHFNAIDAGNRLIIHTDWQAPRYRLFSASFTMPEQARWKEIVAEQSDPLERVAAAGGRLFLEYLHNVTTRITVHALDGRREGEVRLPGLGTASITGRPRQRTAYVSFTTLSTPPAIFEHDTATGQQKPYFRSLPDWNAGLYEVKQVWCASKDGARIPMFLAHRKGLKPSGGLPVLLTGYGGFNVSLRPRFSTQAAVWMEHGGVWALANLRGGAEFGEEWHRAGMLANKQNVFDDFIAAAEWLIANKYTNPKRLAIMGHSNGGLLVGAALTQRPDLFRAVVCGYPDLDMVGYWRFPNNNKPALLEYGDASKPEEFRFLLKYSPYQNVKEGVQYPAVLLTSGDRDTRVPPLQARKMTARLQSATTSDLPVLLHYETESGHVGAVRRLEQLEGPARELAFLFWQLGVE
jgi:prolyl oligopeptidase